MILIGMDRDRTVDTGDNPGPIPLQLIRDLILNRNRVFAIGNQALVKETGAFSLEFLFNDVLGREDAHPPTGRTPEEIDANPDYAKYHVYQKRYRLIALSRAFPEIQTKIVVDDYEIHVKGWTYYTPDEFYKIARAFGWRAE